MGDDSTPMKEVRQFYAYWDTFQTWREFSQYDEYNTEEAQDRYERRYMENENKKIRSKYV
jgi:DnaJ homolog subfamily C member 2